MLGRVWFYSMWFCMNFMMQKVWLIMVLFLYSVYILVIGMLVFVSVFIIWYLCLMVCVDGSSFVFGLGLVCIMQVCDGVISLNVGFD